MIDTTNAVQCVRSGSAVMGLELGSTRIKAVLIQPESGEVLAEGAFNWENRLENGVWTYSLDDVKAGLKACYRSLKDSVQQRYSIRLDRIAAAGISGMMHGYLVLDKEDRLLTPFRTWRNNITGQAAAALTQTFGYPIPQRWSIAHLYQAILQNESHVPAISSITTLAGFVHYLLTGESTMGIGEASGMFPIDTEKKGYCGRCMSAFRNLTVSGNYPWDLEEILPTISPAGEPAGYLTAEGALLLDPSGDLQPGAPFAPPEGDAQSGMAATNSIRVSTGNVSAGTSVFAMVVMESAPKSVHEEIDIVVTPDGLPVGMVHANNCSSEIDAWMELFQESLRLFGHDTPKHEVYDRLLTAALDPGSTSEGMLSYGYHSGEHITGVSEGRPLFLRNPANRLSLSGFMRSHLFSALCALRIGLDILIEEEKMVIGELIGHGGFFKTPGVGEAVMSAAAGCPVRTLTNAGEGGAWGMALLASFLLRKERTQPLPDFIGNFFRGETTLPTESGEALREDFNRFFREYKQCIELEKEAVRLFA